MLVTGALLATGAAAQAQSSDALIDKLVTKGILTADEAQELRNDADEGFTAAYKAKSGMADWVDAVKFNGDFRGRYDGLYKDAPGFVDRHRWRYRLRYGVTIDMLDNFEVGFRLGSGDVAGLSSTVDPISQNATFENNGAKKGIYIDLAYASWSPLRGSTWIATTTIGKMENPFVFSNSVFDRDYTPEGLGQSVGYRLNAQHSLKAIGSAWALDELGGSSLDPYFFGGQLRSISDWNAEWQSTAGVALFSIVNRSNLGNTDVPNINVGNTRKPGVTTAGNATPAYAFNTFVVDAGITYNFLEGIPFYNTKFPITLSGDFMHNHSAPDSNVGYSVGVVLGESGRRGLWDITYRYKHIEGDAWFEEFLNSDSGAYYPTALANSASPGGDKSGYQPGTNIRGHEVRIRYSPFDPITLGATGYFLEAIESTPGEGGSDIVRLQIDALLRF